MTAESADPCAAAAIRSVLRQTLPSLELLVVGPGACEAASTPDAAGDARLIVIEGGRAQALASARGRWIATFDGADYFHPERLEKLVAAAERDHADIVLDDQLVFYAAAARRPHARLRSRRAAAPSWISPSEYIRDGDPLSPASELGALRPLVRRSKIPLSRAVADDDFSLIVRLLLDGARLRLQPELLYFSRERSTAPKPPPDPTELDRLLAIHDDISAAVPSHTSAGEALARRRRSILAARAASTRRPNAPPAASPSPKPSAAIPPAAHPTAKPRIALLSRQRIVGATNGSSNYVLSLARALVENGWDVDFIGASPKLFGRWPVLRLRPETAVFSRYVVHGGARIGRYLVATDPRVVLRGVAATANILARRLLPGWTRADRNAPYAVAAAAARDDMLFVAGNVRPGLSAVLCDYAFLTPLAPFALAPDAHVATIMHDLMSARVSDDKAEPPPREVADLTADEEFRLLSMSDLVIAIQADEEAKVRERLPLVRTVVASWSAPPAAAPQPGKDDALLFVGSNTAPNAGGLRWFLDSCWPLVRAARPSAELVVAGSVCRSLGALPPGVRLLGVVDSLEPLYLEAGVVIAPLRTGSGLKIKLVEALAHGKAVVGTSITTQGVEPLVGGAMAVRDEPQAFAQAVIDLMADRSRRLTLAQSALDCVSAHFTPTACYGPLLGQLGGRTASARTAA